MTALWAEVGNILSEKQYILLRIITTEALLLKKKQQPTLKWMEGNKIETLYKETLSGSLTKQDNNWREGSHHKSMLGCWWKTRTKEQQQNRDTEVKGRPYREGARVLRKTHLSDFILLLLFVFLFLASLTSFYLSNCITLPHLLRRNF